MATTTHGTLKPIDPGSTKFEAEELWDDAIATLLDAGDIEGARAEFERQRLVSLDSGEPILRTPEKWEELRLELHRYALAVETEQRQSSADAIAEGRKQPSSGLPGYTVDALIEQGDLVGAKAELGRLLLAGVTSLNSVQATPEFFKKAREKLRRKAEGLNAKKLA